MNLLLTFAAFLPPSTVPLYLWQVTTSTSVRSYG